MPALLTNLYQNVPGTVTRGQHLLMEPQYTSSTGGNLYYGQAVVIDPITGAITAVSSLTTADQVAGIIARPYPFSTTSVTGALLQAPLQTLLSQVDVVRMGYISVRLQGGGTPTRNGFVYLRVANPPAGSVIGGFEAQPDPITGNTILLGGDTRFYGTLDNQNNIEIFFQAFRSPTSGSGPSPVTVTTVPYIQWTSGPTAAMNQTFSDPSLAYYQNNASRITLVVNGSVLSPSSYTLVGTTLTIADNLLAFSQVQAQAKAVTIATGATSIGFVGPFVSSSTPSANQSFVDTTNNLTLYGNNNTLANVIVNGSTLSPASYTIVGNTLTILDILQANSIVQVEAK